MDFKETANEGMKNKIIIGLAGQMASGKNTVANYIVEKYGGISMSFSEPLRNILKTACLSINRENLSWLGQTLVDHFGSDVLSKIIGEEITKSDKKIFVLTNIRREGDVVCFDNWPGYTLVGVKTDPKICYERLIKRNQNADDQNKTWDEFQNDLQRSTEVDISLLIKKASIIIDNNGTLEDLYKQVDQVMEKLII